MVVVCVCARACVCVRVCVCVCVCACVEDMCYEIRYLAECERKEAKRGGDVWASEAGRAWRARAMRRWRWEG